MAIKLGKVLANEKIKLIYGGGNMGLMGLVATSAYVKGSSVLGVIPRMFKENALYGPTICRELPIWSIPKRLAIMFDTADAFITLPIGFVVAILTNYHR
ncbi:hypothetical protein J1N35_028712 [Gossypium stocksii]|uniref:Uncharacterized protein n=1 Tax=Gossypium stocksii TaxID=47602 RepID=A0A9D3UWW9_9ROSI|nr:hypothetical protein J1N35_028712 [Gossypium stocksii]